MNSTDFNVLGIVLVTVAIGLLPLAIVTITAFLKISIVLFLLRNALGIQQTPPAMVLYGVALILTAYVSAPLLAQIQVALTDPTLDFQNFDHWLRAAEAVSVPVRDYLLLYSAPAERSFLLSATAELWPPEMQETASDQDFLILVPAFVISELTRAFEIGFLLYLPFIAIDLVVSAILMSMGMVMVSPLVISVPFKLFLFVLVEGWSRLLRGLLLSYS
jgi:type III secretion protein R